MTARAIFIVALARAGVPAAEARTVHAQLVRLGRRSLSVAETMRRAELVVAPVLARAARRLAS